MKDGQSLIEDKLNSAKYKKILKANFLKPATLIPILLLTFIAGCAIFASILAPTNPYDLSLIHISEPTRPY